MNNYSIDTDAGIGTILSHFSTEYINHVIDDSLKMKFRPFDGPMPNMVDVIERNFQSILANSPDFVQQVQDTRLETYKEIIYKICNYYNLTFTGDFENIDIGEVYGIAHTLYDIFISKFTSHMNDFFVSYIVNNADSIVAYLKTDDNSNKPKEVGFYNIKNFVDPKFVLIHANINKVIYNMAGYDISLQTLLNYFLDPITAQRIGSLVQDCGDIYKNYYAYYILDQRYSAGVLTNIKLSLQSRTVETFKI